MKSTEFDVKKLLKKFLGFSSHSYISFFITLLSTYLLTRLFSTEENGKINMFLLIQSLIVYISLFGLDQAYCRYYNELPENYSRKKLFVTCLNYSLFVNSIISLLCLLLWKPLSNYIGGEYSFFTIVFLIVVTFTYVICRYFNVYQRMSSRILSYNILAISLSMATKLSYVISSLWKPNYSTALILISVSMTLITVSFSFIIKSQINMDNLSNASIKYNTTTKDSVVNYKLLKFGAPLMPISLISWLNSSVPQIAMKKNLSFSDIGIYSNAVTLSSVVNIIQSGFNTFWTPFVYENYKTNPNVIKYVHNLITYIMCGFGLCLMLFQDIVYLIVGNEYKSSQQYLAFLIISPICYTIAETSGVGINISKKSYLHLFHYLSSILLNCLISFLFMPKIGILAAGIAVSLSSILSLIVKTYVGQKYFEVQKKYVRTFSSIFILLTVAFLNYFMYKINILRSLIFIVAIVILIFIYLNETVDVIKFIKRQVKNK